MKLKMTRIWAKKFGHIKKVVLCRQLYLCKSLDIYMNAFYHYYLMHLVKMKVIRQITRRQHWSIDLEHQLKESLANLEANQIAAYYQLADWLADIESEVAHLNDEIQRKTQLQDKLVVVQQAALAVQAKANSVLKDSQNAINAATASLQELRDLYETELNRRNEENAIIDEYWKWLIKLLMERNDQYRYINIKIREKYYKAFYIIIALIWDN
ncbi:unnamed protein product [Paramecium octaurelia]|uniref:Uncharacterized protein n=1 Tax=Paramecium octaurelia TaxID=43137 RepID=A0A8S1TPR6_PAROT|nr:unnamed protein product [Paramecium octaurelia]